MTAGASLPSADDGDYAVHLEDGVWWTNPAPGQFEAGKVIAGAWRVSGNRFSGETP